MVYRFLLSFSLTGPCLGTYSNLDAKCRNLWVSEVSDIRPKPCVPNSFSGRVRTSNGTVTIHEYPRDLDSLVLGTSILESSGQFVSVSDLARHTSATALNFQRLTSQVSNSSQFRLSKEGAILYDTVTNEMQPIYYPLHKFHIPRGSSHEFPPIHFLVIDSTSRISLEEFSPRIRQVLRDEGFEWMELFGPVSPGGTRAAVFPLIYGGLPVNCPETVAVKDVLARLIDFSAVARSCNIPERRLLKMARVGSGKYKTALAEMTGSRQYFLAEDIDHFMPAFPLWSSKEKSSAQIDNTCLGDRRGIEHVLEFSKNFLEISRINQVNPFLITHLSGSHDSPVFLRVNDDTISRYIEEISRNFPDTLLFVMGDHGLVDIRCDYQRPFLAIRSPRNFPEIFKQNLKTNRNGKMSVWDLHHTLLSLVSNNTILTPNVPLIVMPLSKFDHPFNVSITNSFTPRNIFTSVLPENRNCLDAGMSLVSCVNPDEVENSLSSFEGWICSGPPPDLPQRPRDNAKYKILHSPGEPGLFTFCQQMLKVAEQAVIYINALRVGRDAMRICKEAELGFLEFVSIEKSTGVYDLLVHVTVDGKSDVVASFLFSVSNMDTEGVLSVRLMGFRQETRFKRHEHCTPKGMSPEVCLCNP